MVSDTKGANVKAPAGFNVESSRGPGLGFKSVLQSFSGTWSQSTRGCRWNSRRSAGQSPFSALALSGPAYASLNSTSSSDVFNAPIQQRAARRTVRCKQLSSGVSGRTDRKVRHVHQPSVPGAHCCGKAFWTPREGIANPDFLTRSAGKTRRSSARGSTLMQPDP